MSAPISELAVRGWIGPAQQRLAVQVPAGQCRQANVPAPGALLRRVAGLAGPLLWLHFGDRDWRTESATARARAGLATVDGQLAYTAQLRVLDVILAGRPLAGPLGALFTLTTRQRNAAHEREAEARGLAGRLGLGPLLDDPLATLDPRAAVIVDLARALLAEPRAMVAALPEDPEAASELRGRLAAEAARRAMPVLLLRRAQGG